MGAAWSSPPPSASIAHLSESEAFAIATAWHTELRGIVLLSGEFPNAADESPDALDRKFTIVPWVEYVDFLLMRVDSARLRRVALAARAASLVWFALTCCPGFGGRENPQFWWRVLFPVSLASAKPAKHYNDSTYCHQIRMSEKRLFPSVRVVAARGDAVSSLQLFLFGAGTRLTDDKKLAVAMHELEPFVSEVRWRRDFTVAVRCENLGSILGFLAQVPQRRGGDSSRWRRYEVLGVSEVHCPCDTEDDRAHVDALLGANINLTIYVSAGTESQRMISHSERWMRCEDTRSQPRLRIELLDQFTAILKPAEERTAYFQSCCSLMPLTKSIRSFSAVIRRGNTLLTDADTAWLGYAIFNPDTKTDGSSSFTDLSLYLGSAIQYTLPILDLMARGNNLLVALGVTNVVSQAYYQARLRVGTRVRSTRDQTRNNDSDGSEHEDTSIAMTITNPATWLTLCLENPSETSSLELDDSVRVVVPGIGICWVCTNAILEVHARPPSVSRIRRLCLRRYVGMPHAVLRSMRQREEHEDFGVGPDVFAILSVLGSQLLFLDLDGMLQVSATGLQSILRLCPNLKCLRVRHDGLCWSDPSGSLLPDNQRLEQLELKIDDLLRPLVAPQVSCLQVLHVAQAWPGTFADNRAAFVSLLDACPSLHTLTWDTEEVRLADHNTTMQLLGDSIQPGINDLTHQPMAVVARVAFLSVVSIIGSDEPHNPLGLMGDPDIARLIFAFSTCLVPRRFHINDLQ